MNQKALLSASLAVFTLGLLAASACRAAAEDGPASSPTFSSSASLPDAPAPRKDVALSKGSALADRILNEVDPGYNGVANKWDVTINKGVKVQPFNRGDKVHYAFTEEYDPVSLFSASLAAGYEHLRDTDPHFGSDSAGYGERLGAAAFRQGVNRIFGDGILPALTHEDPRYYRVAEGSILSRAGQSALQTLVRHRDNGTVGINYSGLAAHAMADGLPITFYPQVSAKASVAAKGFSTSLAADAGLKLVREFLPDLFHALKLVNQP